MAAQSARAPSREQILRHLTEMYQGPSWLGSSVRQALRKLTPKAAAWRPAAGRNTAWELVLHLACARHIMIGRLVGERIDRFPRRRRSSWWPVSPADTSPSAWVADVELLAEFQVRLLDAVASAPASRFAKRRRGRRWTIGEELLGMGDHDAYHAGQMMLLARLAPAR